MVSPTVNVREDFPISVRLIRNMSLQVTRYTALFSGIFYGFYHHRSLQAKHDQQKLEHAAHSRERLIADAKEAWKRKKEAKSSTRTCPTYMSWLRLLARLAFNFLNIPSTVVTNTEDPRFDLEKYLVSLDKAS